MAKQKKTGRKSRDKTIHPDPQMQAEALARGVSESAQQIWLAGVGAFARAQTEGNKVFESLVREGMGFEKTARKTAGEQAEAMREAMESRMGQARDRANETWKRLEGVFETRVGETLSRLGVPTRAELAELNAKVDALGARPASTSRRTATRKSTTSLKTPRKAPAAKAAKKATKKKAKKPAAKKTAATASARRVTTRSRTPAAATRARTTRKS